MNNHTRDKRTQQLRAQRAELLTKVAAEEAELEAIRADQQPELMDQAQSVVVARLITELDEHEKREIEAIDVALRRVVAGTYGNCQRCGEPIAAARLEALPATPLCLECAQADEASHPARPRLT